MRTRQRGLTVATLWLLKLQEGSMDDTLAPTTAYTEEDEEQVDLRLEDLRTQIREVL